MAVKQDRSYEGFVRADRRVWRGLPSMFVGLRVSKECCRHL